MIIVVSTYRYFAGICSAQLWGGTKLLFEAVWLNIEAKFGHIPIPQWIPILASPLIDNKEKDTISHQQNEIKVLWFVIVVLFGDVSVNSAMFYYHKMPEQREI